MIKLLINITKKMNNIDKIRKYSIIISRVKKTEEKTMAARIWKKVLFFILIIACLFNIINKLVHKASMEQEVKASVEYMQEQEKK